MKTLASLGDPSYRTDAYSQWPCPHCAPRKVSRGKILWYHHRKWGKCLACGVLYKADTPQKPQHGVGDVFIQDAYIHGSGTKTSPEGLCGLSELSLFPVPQNSEEWEYLLDRGLTLQEIEQYARYLTPGRVCFPIFQDGRVVSYQERVLGAEGDRKYLTPSGSPRDLVWGLDRIRKGEPVYVCEGVFDALYFFTGVAVLGSAISSVQAAKILDRDPGIVVISKDYGNENDWRRTFLNQNRSWVLQELTSLQDMDWGDRLAKGERHAS